MTSLMCAHCNARASFAELPSFWSSPGCLCDGKLSEHFADAPLTVHSFKGPSSSLSQPTTFPNTKYKYKYKYKYEIWQNKSRRYQMANTDGTQLQRIFVIIVPTSLTPPKIQYQMYLPKYEIVKPNLDDTKYYFMLVHSWHYCSKYIQHQPPLPPYLE